VIKTEDAKILKYKYHNDRKGAYVQSNKKVIPIITGQLEPSQNHSENI